MKKTFSRGSVAKTGGGGENLAGGGGGKRKMGKKENYSKEKEWIVLGDTLAPRKLVKKGKKGGGDDRRGAGDSARGECNAKKKKTHRRNT